MVGLVSPCYNLKKLTILTYILDIFENHGDKQN